MKHFLSILLSLIFISSYSQTFSVGRTTINFKDASRTGGSAANANITIPVGGTGRSVGTELFYPALTNGNNTTVANGQFPVVVFGHGFVMAASDYTNVAQRLASKGYIVALPRTENEGPLPFPFPDHAEFANDIKFLAAAVRGLNTTTVSSVSSFNGKVTTKSAIGGHSMGGGCSYIAAQNNSTVTCLFNMAAATSNTASATNSSTGGAGLVTIPTLVISGEKDNVADTLVQNNHYNPTASNIKFHVIIKDVTHCDFGNGTSTTCNIGQPSCTGANCNQILFERYMTYLEPFLANQLKNDCGEGQRFMDSINTNSSNRVGRKIIGSLPCITTNLNELDSYNLANVFPNPANNSLTISFKHEIESFKISIYDMTGKQIYNENIQEKTYQKIIDITDLDFGIYFLKFESNNTSWMRKLIKQ
jgi:dienelactone hydrolase